MTNMNLKNDSNFEGKLKKSLKDTLHKDKVRLYFPL